MSSWLPSSWFGNSQPESKPQTESSQKTEIIDKQMMQSINEPDSNKKQHENDAQIPRQINSQSSSSSGFQQIIIQDGQTPQKSQQHIGSHLVQKQIQKVDDREFDMYRTMNFDEDLNQSISDPYKNVKKSSFADRNLMQFSGASNTNEKSFSDLSSHQKQMEDSFSNISTDLRDKNLESFSELDQPRAILRASAKIIQKEQIDSDDQNEITQSQNEPINPMNEYLSIWGIDRKTSSDIQKQNISKVHPSERKNSQSFSELDEGYKPSSKKPEEIQYIPIEWSMDGGQQQPKSDLIDLSDLEKSFVAPSIKPIGNNRQGNVPRNDAFSKSPSKPQFLSTPKKFTKQSIAMPKQINMGESFVMSPIQEKPHKKFANETIQMKAKQPVLQKFKIHSKDFVHFIRYGQTEDRLISQKLLQSIIENFLLQNIMLPIFNIKLMQDIENEMEIERKELKQTLFTICINLYFELLDKKYPQEMKRFFESQQSSKNIKSQVGIAIKRQENAVFLGHFYKKVFDYFKLNHYSKAQILKKTLQSQLAFVSEYKESWLQSWSDKDIETEESKVEKAIKQKKSEQLQNVKEKERYLLKKIAELQVLISFEKSEMYCEEKLTEKMEQNIWKERKRKLTADRNWFISHLFGHCFI